jgi:hypothetical protein
MNEATRQQVDELLLGAARQVESASRLVPPGVGAAGENIREVLLDTAEKIGYALGLIEDEQTAKEGA